MRIIIVRELGWKQKKHQVKGEYYIYHENSMIERLKCLELPWRNNEYGISCFPLGKYKGKKHYSPDFGWSIWIQDVPNRSEILTHAANFVGSPNPETGEPDLRGCVAPGLEFEDITGDGIVEVVSSAKAMKQILDCFDEGEEMDVIVTSEDEL